MERLRVGVLGARRGRTHIVNLLQVPEAVVIGVADRSEALRDAVREPVEAQGGVLVAEYDELLALRPDAVVVATNGRMQVEHSCQALEAGCAVVSEIPGAFTADELLRLRDCVQRTGGYYMLGENTCFWEFFRYFRKWVVEGRLGEVTLAEGEYLHCIPHTLEAPDGARYTPTQAKSLGLTGLRPTWRADQPPIQYLTHDLGPLLEVLDDRCVSVSCRSTAWRSPDTPLRADGQIALFETAKGNLIKILVTLSSRLPSEHRYRLMGTGGSAEWFLYEDHARLFDTNREERQGWERFAVSLAATAEEAAGGHGGADTKMMRCFVKAVLEGRPAPIDVYRGIEYCLPGIIAHRSAELGGEPLPIPDWRPAPYAGTGFWDHVAVPTEDPARIE